MAEENLHQPHDKLVKATFSDLQNARAFFEGHLEPELVRHIDWASLRLESGSFVDPELSASARSRDKFAESKSRPESVYPSRSTSWACSKAVTMPSDSPGKISPKSSPPKRAR